MSETVAENAVLITENAARETPHSAAAPDRAAPPVRRRGGVPGGGGSGFS